MTGRSDTYERDALTGARDYLSLRRGFPFDEYEGRCVFVAVCDIDDFHKVNAEYGRIFGDEVLVLIVRVMQELFGDEHVYRYGSDEFIIMGAPRGEKVFRDDIAELFDRLSAIEFEGRRIAITLSVGYTYGELASANDVHEAIHTADRFAYEAKRLGKARAAGAALHRESLGDRHEVVRKSYEVDELTGLSNLISFRAKVTDMLESDIGCGEQRLALVYFNVENFKAFNERFGFDAGDEMLLHVSDAVKSAFPGAPASRFSADQFMVATTKSAVQPGIEQVRMAFRRRIKDSSIWLKAGVNIVDDGDDDVGLVCDRAKLACDAIKGRRDVYWRAYDGDLKRSILLRRYVLDHFDDALENGWVKIFYQPIMRVATGEVCDEEALARWVDPERGLISPADFIPVLEEARLIHRLDLYMVRRACENMQRLRRDGIEVAPVSINLSRLDFELCDIVAEVMAILDEFDIPHDMLSIEVTESALAGNQEFLKSEIDRFRANGFEVWMDDFGSGYSSLHLLTDYKFDLVKVDMGFLRDFETNEQTRVMLAHIISMTKELGFKTLVEGVETPEQFAFLKAIGCGRAQGFLLGKPASLNDMEAANAENRYPNIERDVSHPFYEAIGRVNLMRPDPVPPIAGHYVPGDSAAAVICRTRGVYEYFNVSDIYRVHLARMGGDSIERASEQLNDPSQPVHVCFENAISRLSEVGDWVDVSYEHRGIACNLHIRLIATYPEGEACALLVIVKD